MNIYDLIIEKYKDKVTKKQIEEYIKYYPSKVAKKLMEYRLYEAFA